MTESPALMRSAPRYPAESVELRMLADGRPLLVRPLAAKDGELLQDFVRGLSVTARYQRFLGGVRELAPEVLQQLLSVDYGRRMAFAAVLFEHGHRRMIGEARYAPSLDGSGAVDFAIAVSDGWQRQGLGRLLLGRLLRYAASRGITQMQGDVLHNNRAMLALAEEFGFNLRRHPDGAWLTRVERTTGSLATAA
jgi:GNAT superfamily N-acetyltransferase